MYPSPTSQGKMHWCKSVVYTSERFFIRGLHQSNYTDVAIPVAKIPMETRPQSLPNLTAFSKERFLLILGKWIVSPAYNSRMHHIESWVCWVGFFVCFKLVEKKQFIFQLYNLYWNILKDRVLVIKLSRKCLDFSSHRHGDAVHHTNKLTHI